MLKQDLIQEFLKVGCKVLVDDATGYVVLDGTGKFREVFITLGDCGMNFFGNGIIEFFEIDGGIGMMLDNVLINDIDNIKYISINTDRCYE